MRSLRNIRVFAAAVLPFALPSLPAWAEEAGAGGQGGLPQFDVSQYPAEIFWLVVTFALLYLLMAGVALPRVARTQESRKKIIASEIEAARAANDAAIATVATVEKSLGEARAKAQASVSAMIAEVNEESTARQAEQERALSRSLHSAEAEIAVMREAALKEIRGCVADLAAAVVGKILGSRERAGA
ncbi:MAG: ATPase [Alphaproteobacteria bacterium]|nr:ATPase [Alphaproteobacteria bacterium]